MSTMTSMRARIYAAFSLALIALLLLGIISNPNAARAIIAGGLVGFGLIGVNYYLFDNLVLERRRAELALRKSNENLNISVQALERTTWNQTRAAALLGLNRDQIRYRIEKFQLEKAPSP